MSDHRCFLPAVSGMKWMTTTCVECGSFWRWEKGEWEVVTERQQQEIDSGTLLKLLKPPSESDGSVDVSESLLGGLAADAEDDADPSPARPVAPGPTDGVDQAGAGPFDSLLSLVQSDEGLADLGGAQRPGTGISDHSVNDALTPPGCQEDIDAQHDGPVVPASGLETTTGTTGPQDHTNGSSDA